MSPRNNQSLQVLLLVAFIALLSCFYHTSTGLVMAAPQQISDSQQEETNHILEYENADDFTKRVREGDPDTFHLVKFFAPWCGHCQRLEPVWQQLAEEYNEKHPEKNVQISRVDCTTQSKICSAFGVKGYPSLYAFWNGQVVDEYRQRRSLEGLQSYIEHMIQPLVFEDLIVKMNEGIYARDTPRRGSTWLILMEDEEHFFDDEEVKSVAQHQRGSNIFVSRVNCDQEESLCKKFSKVGEKPAAVLLRAGAYVIANGAKSAVALRQFIDDAEKSLSTHVMTPDKHPRPGVEGLEGGSWVPTILAVLAGVAVIGAFFLCLIVCLYLEDEEEEDEKDPMLKGKDLGVTFGGSKRGLKKD